MGQGWSFVFTLVLNHQPLPDVHLTNVAVQKTSPDYHPKKVRKLGFCPPGPAFWDWVGWGGAWDRPVLGSEFTSEVRSTLPTCGARTKSTDGDPHVMCLNS